MIMTCRRTGSSCTSGFRMSLCVHVIIFCATGGKRGTPRGRNNLQGTQITQKPTAWAHAVSLCARAFSYLHVLFTHKPVSCTCLQESFYSLCTGFGACCSQSRKVRKP